MTKTTLRVTFKWLAILASGFLVLPLAMAGLTDAIDRLSSNSTEVQLGFMEAGAFVMGTGVYLFAIVQELANDVQKYARRLG